MKKILVKALALGAAAVMAVSLAACGNGQKEDPTTESTVAPTPYTEATQPTETQAFDYSGYLTVEESATVYGKISLPRYNTTKLNADDAKSANALTDEIKNIIMADVDAAIRQEQEAAANTEAADANAGEDATEETAAPETAAPENTASETVLASTTVNYSKGVMSVIVEYALPTGLVQKYTEMLNFDTETGKVLTGEETAQKLGYTLAEAEAAMKYVASKLIIDEEEYSRVSNAANALELPDFSGVSDELDYKLELMMNSFNNLTGPLAPAPVEETDGEEGGEDAEGEGEPEATEAPETTEAETSSETTAATAPTEPPVTWDTLPLRPQVAVGENGLFCAFASVPAQTQTGTADRWIVVGHNDDETDRQNPCELYNVMGSRTAAAAVQQFLGLNALGKDANGTQWSTRVENLEYATTEDISEPVYSVFVYTGDEENYEGKGYYGVGAASGRIYTWDSENSAWNITVSGAAPRAADALQEGRNQGASAVIFNNADAFDLWQMGGTLDVDMTSYGTGKTWQEQNSETLLFMSLEDG
ncbi:MAG: hypothetical protein HUJ75_05680, partial [Parasporobacterium sp.]|nr:hypothetical protein [Parasporobacterium sp.]